MTGSPTGLPSLSVSWTLTGCAGSHPVPVTLVLPPAGTEVGSTFSAGFTAAVTVSGVLVVSVPWVPTTVSLPGTAVAGTGRSVAGSAPSAVGVTVTGLPTGWPAGSVSWSLTGCAGSHPVPVMLVFLPAGTDVGSAFSAGFTAAVTVSGADCVLLPWVPTTV